MNHPATLSFDKSFKTVLNEGDPSGFIFAFPQVKFEAGTLKAVGYDKSGKAVADYTLETAGAPAAVKLTPHTSDKGLMADGEDIAFYDVEVVDAKGRRCPTDESRIDFQVSGPGIWRGGYNSGIVGSTNNLYLNTEDGINRVAIRSTLAAGDIVLHAAREGIEGASVTVTSKPIGVKDGLSDEVPQ